MFHARTHRYNIILLSSAALLFLAPWVVDRVSSRADAVQSTIAAKSDEAIAQSILAERFCPCGCGNYLPGSSKSPACFGCSVGKAEISRVRERLAAGRTPEDIIKELNERVLVDVFSDYTENGLAEIWNRAKRVSSKFNQHRVVLRPLGTTEDARRAIKLVECARAEGMFTVIHEALIEHSGPWDQATLLELATERGLAGDKIAQCFKRVDIEAQIAKDRQHAKALNANKFPAVSVNRKLTSAGEEALRKAIRKFLIQGTI